MSILREVIESVEEVEWNNLNERLPILIKEVHICRTEVFKILDDFYLKFIQKPVKIQHFGDEILEFQKELEILGRNCEQGMIREIHSPKKHKDFKAFLETVQNTLKICKLVNNCYHIHEMFVDLQFHKNNCGKSLQIMNEIRDIIDNSESAILLKYHRNHFKLMESTMQLRFGEVLSAKFVIEVKEKNTISYIKARKNVEIGDSIQLLLQYFQHIKQLDDLIDFIWEFLIVPIVTCGVTMILSDSEIELKIIRKKEPYYKDVFKRLHAVNSFLRSNFDICIDSTEGVSLLDYVGNQLKDRISSLLIEHCLKKFGDNGSFDHEQIILDVEVLLSDLNITKLVSDDSLLRYAKDLEQTHRSRLQEKFFEDVKMIMTKKNYDIVKVGSPLANKSAEMLKLPSMSISSVVQDLHQLTETILLQAKEDKLHTDAVFNIFNLFRNYTLKNVEEMTSQEVALLYNNYTYIAHELRSWNILYSHVTLEDNTVPLFKDQSYLFQIAGEDVLDNFSVKKKNKLEIQLNKVVADNDEISIEFFEATIRKCLREIELLIESWFDLLSQAVFNRYIGFFFDILCNSLVKFILKFESIDKNLIEKTSTVFDTILKLVEKYFLEATDMKKFINCWGQFEALIYVLKSDLVEIEINKYYELLKSNFKPYEVKKILKAIFEESERRDAILFQLQRDI